MRATARRLFLSAFRQAIRPLREGTREPMIEALLPKTRPILLAPRIAQQAGFSGLLVEGANGVICGSEVHQDALGCYAALKTWAPYHMSLFGDLFRPHGGTYLDIGANIGLTLVPIARHADVDCHAFEPSPDNLWYLCRNVSMNGRGDNVQIHAIALCDRDGDLTFELAPKASGDNRIRLGTESDDQLNEKARPTIRVPGRRLDAMLPQPIRRPLGIKIDTQGAEPLVVSGGSAVFAQADLVSMEFWPYGLFRLDGDVAGLIAFCRDHYREGSASEEGDREHAAPEWRPMAEIADILAQYSAHRSSPERYLNVLMRC